LPSSNSRPQLASSPALCTKRSLRNNFSMSCGWSSRRQVSLATNLSSEEITARLRRYEIDAALVYPSVDVPQEFCDTALLEASGTGRVGGDGR
jgi:hypothetical protein